MDLLKKEIERKRKAIAMAKESISSQFPQGSSIETVKQQGPETEATTTDAHIKKNKTSFMKAVEVRKFEETLQRQATRELKKAAGTTSTAHDDSSTQTHNSLVDPCKNASLNPSKTSVTDSNKTSTLNSTKSMTQERSDVSTVNNNTYILDEKIQNMSTDQITRELRDLGLPIWVFGERNDVQRRKRLIEAKETIQAMAAGISEMDDFRLGSGYGIRNPFLVSKKSHKEKEQQLQQQQDEKKEKNLSGLRQFVGDSSSSFHPIDPIPNNLNSTSAGIATSRIQDLSENHTTDTRTTTTTHVESSLADDEDHHKKIHGFFKTLLRQWEEELAQRPDSIRRTAAGKNETKTLKQCKDYIRPLLKLCKNRRLEENMLNHILKIVNFCIEGEFVKANDAYMDVAIGRAAWPIGVTMVGIHARSGRARIESSNVAHVMNSEMQRKYLTSVKRLITFCQKKRTDLPPSKKVLNF